jgi:predicted membrane channel-forming protein YqfA (hemolysin III family)
LFGAGAGLSAANAIAETASATANTVAKIMVCFMVFLLSLLLRFSLLYPTESAKAPLAQETTPQENLAGRMSPRI